ncbi:cleavage and polyadenylation specificity factor subunit 2, partial [Nosema bombycis CQ1]
MECDVILITGFGLEYIGALPFLINHNYYKPIYMTLPNKILGNIVLEEQMNILKNYYKFDLKKSSNILDNSEIIIDIKYMQPFNIKDINVCAYNSGYSLGSTLFKLTVGVQNIYLGFNLNHRKENLLDGVDLNKIKDPFLFITNSNYVFKDDVSCKVRDADIKKFIDKYLGKKMKLIFVIDYSRFLELALILNSIKNKKIVCLSYQLKKFIERAKSMIEWSGSKALETFYKEKSNPFEFDNIDFVECKLFDYKQIQLRNTIVVFFNEDKEDQFIKESKSKRIYEYSGKIIEQNEESSSESSEVIEEEMDSSEEKDFHWSNFNFETWREKTFLEEEKKQLPITEDLEYEIIYGKLNLEPFNKITDQSQNIFENGTLEIKFPLNKKPRNYDNYGETCDLNSIKMILQGSEPQKVVIIPDDYESGKMFYYSFIYSNSICQYYVCLNTLNLSADTSVSIVNLSEDFLKIDYKTIGNDNIAQFKGKKNGNVVEYLGKPADIMVANLELNDLKKKLIENNLKVETNGNVLIVEKKTFLKLDGNELYLEGEHSDFYYYVRNILYQNIAII